MAVGGTFQFRVELDRKTFGRLDKALRVLGETDAPFLRAALEDVGSRFASEIRSRAPGGIAGQVGQPVIKGKLGQLKSVGAVRHPGSRSMEFGRVWYRSGYTVVNHKFVGGTKVKRRGQTARPFVGVIKGDAATAATQPYARERLTEAVEREWDRIGKEG